MNDSNNLGKQQVLLEMQTAGLPADLTEQIYKFSQQLRRGETRAAKHVQDLTQDILATYREEMADFLRQYLYARWKTQAPQWLQTDPILREARQPNLNELSSIRGASSIDKNALSLIKKILGSDKTTPSLTDVATLARQLSPTEWSRMALGYQYLFERHDSNSLACLSSDPNTQNGELRISILHARAIANDGVGRVEEAVRDYGKASEEGLEFIEGRHASQLRYLSYSASRGSQANIEEAFEHSSISKALPVDVDEIERIAISLPRGACESLIRKLLKRANPDQGRILLAILKENQ